ncbi:hypothetical protein SBA3_4910013 [Candidatus Sulfopaludibacter sp. SbA3]|nr:hypothetical protein SBA3_4910013 [Candidatus Sulfopaludibacter sp. SbA3]
MADAPDLRIGTFVATAYGSSRQFTAAYGRVQQVSAILGSLRRTSASRFYEAWPEGTEELVVEHKGTGMRRSCFLRVGGFVSARSGGMRFPLGASLLGCGPNANGLGPSRPDYPMGIT